MMRILLEIVIGIFIYVNPETRQVTADLLRAARGALSPDEKDKILQNRINKPLERHKRTSPNERAH